MATTTNPIITDEWAEIVNSTTAYFLLSLPFESFTAIEVVVWGSTGDAANIDVVGHKLTGVAQESISRTVLGDGFVYARCLDGAAAVVLSK